ncbi:hypothetical protein RSOLAG1IB_10935 [Rhizoctonia solani AG-1 IB]|uniref:Uncharacterized protein n=1 Tax=Thanatephorus cucumeris (strain AG1-IB / isolate 7/3/14) TaxID=1108050 RepID=A0A0B7G629_THACB|nr:hypothetical protein RSOLAG1IB_10935 [Rhizoctonia solani AG-1 IB]
MATSRITASFASISNGTNKERCPLHFTEWGQGSIFEWYDVQKDPMAKRIERIQIWKDISGPVPHRFIVLHMCDKRIHRLDRRPNHKPPQDQSTKEKSVAQSSFDLLSVTNWGASPPPLVAHDIERESLVAPGTSIEVAGGMRAGKGRRPAPFNTMSLLFNQAVACEDSYVIGIDIATVRKVAVCEVEIALHDQIDIMAVISTCYAIHKDEKTRDYSFLRYNCFFFSWTILMTVSRRHQPYEIPAPDSVINQFYSRVDQITEFIVDKSIALFLDLVVDTLSIIRDEAGTSLHPGMSAGGKLVWAMPLSLLRFMWRQLFNARLHCGLRTQLTKMVKAQIENISRKVQEAALSKHAVRNELNEHLWIEDVGPKVRTALKEEIMAILWKAIIEAISTGLGSMSPEDIANQIQSPSFKFGLMGKDVRQFCAVSSAALHGGLQAVKDVSDNLGTNNEVAFRMAWDAASQGALIAAQIVAENTSRVLNSKPARVEMYHELWKIWDRCWGKARELACPKAVDTVSAVVEKLMASGADAVIEELKNLGAVPAPIVPGSCLGFLLSSIAIETFSRSLDLSSGQLAEEST